MEDASGRKEEVNVELSFTGVCLLVWRQYIVIYRDIAHWLSHAFRVAWQSNGVSSEDEIGEWEQLRQPIKELHLSLPGAPFCGLLGTMIEAAKRERATFGNADAKEEELMTAFAGAEALVNSKPLTYQSASPSTDYLPLTPRTGIIRQ